MLRDYLNEAGIYIESPIINTVEIVKVEKFSRRVEPTIKKSKEKRDKRRK